MFIREFLFECALNDAISEKKKIKNQIRTDPCGRFMKKLTLLEGHHLEEDHRYLCFVEFVTNQSIVEYHGIQFPLKKIKIKFNFIYYILFNEN